MNTATFDTSAYEASRQSVIQQIKASHDWEKTEGFIADGVINPAVYALQPVRILCVLAESYGYDENQMEDIQRQPETDLMGLSDPKVQSPRKLATLLHLMHRTLETGVLVSEDEWREMPEFFCVDPTYTAILQTALSKVAWINVKKASRSEGTKMDSLEVAIHAQRNRAVLQEQISSMEPHIIIVCGRVPFESLLDLGLLGGNVQLGRRWEVQTSDTGSRVIEISHPAYPRDWCSYKRLYQNYTRIVSQFPLSAPFS